MKITNLVSLVFLLFAFITCKHGGSDSSASATSFAESDEVKAWRDNKLGMMVHFGLYSMFGGVYQGQNISKGYSEQIMAHAPIPHESYKALAASFNPTNWNADTIAQIAHRGGFRSVVITAKHHDGFNMYDSQFSDFSISKASPFKRDIIKEMSEACSRTGIGLGIYYSLIDWNAKEGATTISTHNADPISPALHQLNLHQVHELCTNYGNLTEIWFDMGSLTLQQSKEIRALVKDLQPGCMISGRLGNGQGDFVVLGDNQLTDFKMDRPWQAVASTHPSTWGYRSWQPIEDINKTTSEILSNMTKAVYRGGNYLLNIGPKGDGSILETEKKILENIGTWLGQNGEAIYNTRPYAVGEKNWGACTYNAPIIYAHVMNSPDEGKILFYGLNNNLVSASTLLPPYHPLATTQVGATTTFDLGLTPLSFNPSTILRIELDGNKNPIPGKLNYANTQNKYELTYHNATIRWSEDGANYYATTPSAVAMSWDLASPKDATYDITVYYTQQEKNKIIDLTINNQTQRLDLSKYKTFRQTPESNSAIPSTVYTQGPYSGLGMDTHPGPLNWANPGEPWGPASLTWTEVPNLDPGKYINLSPAPMQTYYYLINILCSTPTNWIAAFGADDGFQAWLNGKLIHSSGYPQASPNVVFLDLPMEGESNTLILKHLNVKDDFKTFYSFKVDQIRFEKEVPTVKLIPQEINKVSIRLSNPRYPDEAIGIPNLKIEIVQKKK